MPKKVVKKAVKKELDKPIEVSVPESVTIKGAVVVAATPKIVPNGKFQWAKGGDTFFVFNGIGQMVGKFKREDEAATFCLRSNLK